MPQRKEYLSEFIKLASLDEVKIKATQNHTTFLLYKNINILMRVREKIVAANVATCFQT